MWLVDLAVRLVRAVLAFFVRRLTTGPLRPTWTWASEFSVVTLREVLATVDRMPLAALRRFEHHTNRTPVPLPQRRVVKQTPVLTAGIASEWLEPARPTDATLLYLHGGGYVSCSPGTHRHLTSSLAWNARVRVLAIDYRLAPEHPFPAAVDDAVAVYEALLDDGVDPGTLFVAGDSAGGGLTLLLLLELKRRRLPQPAGAICLSPYTDLTWSGESWATNTTFDYLPSTAHSASLRTMLGSWLGDMDPTDARVSPLYADLAGIAPLLVLTGEVELLVDDSRRFVAAARAAGVDVTYVEAPDMVHVYPLVLPMSRPAMEAMALMADFVANRTAAGAGAGAGAGADGLPQAAAS